jgi:hypothetical protein
MSLGSTELRGYVTGSPNEIEYCSGFELSEPQPSLKTIKVRSERIGLFEPRSLQALYTAKISNQRVDRPTSGEEWRAQDAVDALERQIDLFD